MFLGDDLFLRTGSIDVDAAVIGVGRSRWQAAGSSTLLNEAAQIMKHHRFDVLPIDESPEKPVYGYFHTKYWGDWSKNSVEESQVTYQDLLPAKTGILELIERFVKQERLFFFLTYHHRIVGLVSVANLNSRQVNFYLFALICEFESRLARLVRLNLSEDALKVKLDSQACENFERDIAQGFENDIVQYLYLSQLINIVRTEDLYESIGYTSRTNFEKLNSLNELRNQVMHPVRSLVTDRASLNKLWQRIERLQDALFRLRQLQGI